MRKLLIMLTLTATIFACGGGNKLEQGKVLEKSYDDPDSWISMQCAGYNQNGGCSVYIPVTYSDGPHWHVKVVGVDKEGKERTETHEVTQTLFDMVIRGDVVNFLDMTKVPQ